MDVLHKLHTFYDFIDDYLNLIPEFHRELPAVSR